MQGFPCRELGIHPRRCDPHSLLAARLTELVEFRAVEKLAEYASKLLFHDSGSVVFHRHAEHVVSFARHLDPDIGKNAGLLAGIQRVIDRLFDGGQRRFRRRIKTEKVAVLQEELGHRDVALVSRHLVGDVGMGKFARHTSIARRCDGSECLRG